MKTPLTLILALIVSASEAQVPNKYRTSINDSTFTFKEK